jgi:hypothetical protein
MLIAMAGYPPEIQRQWAIYILVALVVLWPLLPLAFCHAAIEFCSEGHRLGFGLLQFPVVIFLFVTVWRRYISAAPSRRAKLLRSLGAYALINAVTNVIFFGPLFFP